jgi:FtsZ-interacting cell division protein ZipA
VPETACIVLIVINSAIIGAVLHAMWEEHNVNSQLFPKAARSTSEQTSDPCSEEGAEALPDRRKGYRSLRGHEVGQILR